MAQRINLNGNNRSVVAYKYSALCVHAPTASGSYGRLAGWQTNAGGFQNF